MSEKFQKLSEKISQLNINNNHLETYHNKSPSHLSKTSKLEIKLESLEDLVTSSLSNFDSKLNLLKDHITNLKITAEEEKQSLEKLKTSYREEFHKFEENVKTSLNEIKEENNDHALSLYNKIETNLYNLENDLKQDNNKIKNSLKTIEECIDVSYYYIR